MKKIISILFLAVFCYGAFGQKALSEQDDFIKRKSLYLNFENGQLNYFTKKNFDDQEPFTKKYQLSLKYTYSNIYLNWLNPLRYKITWKDSTYTDDRDQTVNNFIGLITNQFGSPLTSLNSSDPAKALVAPSIIGSTTLTTPKSQSLGDINSLDLLKLYLEVKTDVDILHTITEPELVGINSLLAELFNLDLISSISIPDSVEKSFINLYNISTYKDVEKVCKEERARLNEIDIIQGIKSSKDKISDLAKKVTVNNNKALEAYVKKSALFIAEKISTENDKNKILLSSLKSIIETVENSLKNRKSDTQEGFYNIRNISFDPGKVLETEITISEYEYNKDKKEFSKKSDIYQSKIKFRKADFALVAVSAGIFYAQTTLKGFGVSTNGQMTVTEDNIDKNTAVTATFLNLYFNLNSRYFSPLFQLGVDPTKKHPYLLAGVGISIPAAKFSISGGPLWTWDASLNKLSIGSTISSTTELDKDIKYKFDGKPKGWYLGLQYNF